MLRTLKPGEVYKVISPRLAASCSSRLWSKGSLDATVNLVPFKATISTQRRYSLSASRTTSSNGGFTNLGGCRDSAREPGGIAFTTCFPPAHALICRLDPLAPEGCNSSNCADSETAPRASCAARAWPMAELAACNVFNSDCTPLITIKVANCPANK